MVLAPYIAAILVLIARDAQAVGSAPADRPPNFLVMMADDLGFSDLGIQGNPYVETPNIDALALESVSFSQFYVHPVCAPTRASLLTGRDFLRTGVWGVHGGRDFINLDEETFGDALGRHGYSTGLFGKWHNGRTDGYLPYDRGFDEVYTTDLYYYKNNRASHNGVPIQTTGWATENIANWTINFMSENRDRPFLAYIPFMAPHLGKEYGAQSENWHAPDAFVLKYQRKGLDAALSRLYGMIDFMDFQVGRMLAAVDRLGLGENTVVAFFSDNGPIDGGRLSTIERDGRNLYNLNGNKGEIFDNGIRVPLFVRWQGHFPPSVVEDALVSITDIFPTMMDLSGARNRTYGKPIDGWSLSKLLYNPKVVSESWKQRVLFHTSGAPEWTRRGGVYVPLPDLGRNKADLVLGRDGRWAVREGRYKLVHFFGREEVFDMIQDPQESSPLDNPILHQHLRNKLGEWWLKMLVDPGSFTTPVFHIGWPGRSTSKVLAMAAVQTSPRVFLHSHDASGWVEEGTFAVYQVNILTTGSYIVRVRVQSTHPIGGVVRVSCDDGRKSSVAGWIMANGYLGVISLQRGGGQCYMEFKIATSTGGAGLYGGRARMESIDFDLLQEN